MLLIYHILDVLRSSLGRGIHCAEIYRDFRKSFQINKGTFLKNVTNAALSLLRACLLYKPR